MTPEQLLAVYDDQVRGSFPGRLPAGWTGEADGPLTRCLTTRGGFAMLTARADDLSAGELEALVQRTVEFYRTRGLRFEWKTFDHDRPEVRALLAAAGAVVKPHEALVLGEAARLASHGGLPPTVQIRQVAGRADLDRIADLQSAVWQEDWSWLGADLEGRLLGSEPIEVFIAEDAAGTDTEPELVSAAWLVPMPGAEVAGLWGGSTRASHRGRGIYRALVAARARRAVDLGYPYLQVDASDDSRPILERLGLQVVGGTQPYQFPAPRWTVEARTAVTAAGLPAAPCR